MTAKHQQHDEIEVEPVANRYLAEARIRILRVLRRYEGLPLFRFAADLFQRDIDARGPLASSALAFRLFLFFPPFLLFITGLAGVFSGHINGDKLANDVGVTGGLADQIRSALSQSGKTPLIMMALGLFGIVWTGRSLSKVLVAVSCAAWNIPGRQKARFKDVGAIAGLCSCIGLVVMMVNYVKSHFGMGAAGLSFVAVLAIYSFVWFVLTALLPKKTDDPGALLPGAVLMGSTLAILEAVSQFYLPDKLSKASQMYGAIGSSIVILGWFFVLGRVMVVSLELNAVMYETVGSISTFVFSLPILRALPRKFPRLHTFFGLGDDGQQPGA